MTAAHPADGRTEEADGDELGRSDERITRKTQLFRYMCGDNADVAAHVPEERRFAANSLVGSTEFVAISLLGPAIGGVLVAVIGAPAVVGIDAASFLALLWAAVRLAASIPTTAGAPMTATSTPPMAGPRWRRTRSIRRANWRHKTPLFRYMCGYVSVVAAHVPEERRFAANSLVGSTEFVAISLLGPAIGGVLVAVIGAPAVVGIDAASFLALLWAAVRLPPLSVAAGSTAGPACYCASSCGARRSAGSSP